MPINLPQKNYETGKYWTHGVMLVEGCTKVSPGCLNCWSEGWAKRYDLPFDQVKFQQERLKRLAVGGKPKVFSIWNDLFHPDVENARQWETFNYCLQRPEHTYMILTKRAAKMRSVVNEMLTASCSDCLEDNIWLGVTAENQEMAEARIPDLLKTRAAKRFLSVEPILGAVDSTAIDMRHTCPFKAETAKLDCLWGHEASCRELGGVPFVDYEYQASIDWVIVGCETGPGARLGVDTINQIIEVVRQCQEAGVPCWVKAVPVYKKGRWVASKKMSEWPHVARVRQVPA